MIHLAKSSLWFSLLSYLRDIFPLQRWFFGNFPNRPWPPLFLLLGKLYRKFSNISNKYSIVEWEYVPYVTYHVMYLLTQNVWPWQDLNLHRSRRDSNPQCLDPSSNALSYATRLLYRLSYTAGRDQALKETAWSWTLQPVSIALPSPCSGGKVANPAWLWDSQFLRYESNWDWGRSTARSK